MPCDPVHSACMGWRREVANMKRNDKTALNAHRLPCHAALHAAPPTSRSASPVAGGKRKQQFEGVTIAYAERVNHGHDAIS